jgi:hypothetical protein
MGMRNLSKTTEKSSSSPRAVGVSKVKTKTVQIEIGLLEYGRNKKAVQTDGLLAKHRN